MGRCHCVNLPNWFAKLIFVQVDNIDSMVRFENRLENRSRLDVFADP
jgi:hypothetical protein